MKQLLSLLLIILISFTVHAQQFPTQLPRNNSTIEEYQQGAIGTMTGLRFRTIYADTAAANVASYIRFIPGFLINVLGELHIRNGAATKWNKVSPDAIVYTASNGITLSANDFRLGGRLTAGNTTISGMGSSAMNFDSLSAFRVWQYPASTYFNLLSQVSSGSSIFAIKNSYQYGTVFFQNNDLTYPNSFAGFGTVRKWSTGMGTILNTSKTQHILLDSNQIKLKADTVTIDIVSKGLGKVATSDANGNVTFQTPSYVLPEFNYYVSTSGNNANAGTSSTLPKQTLSAISGLTSVGLKANDLFREQLTPSVSQTLGAYGKTDLLKYSIISGADTVINWASAGGGSYSRSVTHGIANIVSGGYNGLVVVEIDTALEKTAPITARNYLTWKSSTALVDANAGSFTYTEATPTSVVYIKPTTGNPNSNKYRYEVTKRSFPISAFGIDNLSLNNLWLREAGDGYGTGLGNNTQINNSIFSGFATHHMVIKSGDLNNILIGKTGRYYPGGITPIAFYEAAGTGNVSSVRNTIFLDLPNDIIAHTSGASHQKITLENNYFFCDSSLNTTLNGTSTITTDQVDSLMINKIYVQDKGVVCGSSAPYMEVKNSAFVRIVHFAFRFEHPNGPTQLVKFENVFWLSNVHNRNYDSIPNQSGGFLYRPNSNATVSITKSILHGKSRQTAGSTGSGVGIGSTGTSLNNIIICDVPDASYMQMSNPATSNYNVYVLLKGVGFNWSVNPALNSGNPNATFAQWKSITGQDANSIEIDLRTNPLGLRALFVDPDAGNYTLAASPWKSTIEAMQAGMVTPLKGFITMPTQEDAMTAIMTNSLKTVLTGDWQSGSMGTPYNLDTNTVKFAGSQLTAGRIPYVSTTKNSLMDTTLLTYAVGTGVTVLGNSSSTGSTLNLKNSSNISMFNVNNDGTASIGYQSNTANDAAIVNIVARSWEPTTNYHGVRFHSNQNGGLPPPAVSWASYLNGTFKDRFTIQAPNGDGSLMWSPFTATKWMQNTNSGDVTTSLGTDVNSPAASVYTTFYQLPYFTKGEVVIGRDLAAGSQPESGILRSGQKNTGTDIGGSDLTLRAGGGTGSGSLLGNLLFQTPDVTGSGTTIQAYTTKARITRAGNLLINTATDNSKLTVNGSFATAYVAKTADYTATINDFTIHFTSGTSTFTLPTAIGCAGRIYVVRNDSGNTLTLATTSSQTIDGTTPGTQATGTVKQYQSTGTNFISLN